MLHLESSEQSWHARRRKCMFKVVVDMRVAVDAVPDFWRSVPWTRLFHLSCCEVLSGRAVRI